MRNQLGTQMLTKVSPISDDHGVQKSHDHHCKSQVPENSDGQLGDAEVAKVEIDAESAALFGCYYFNTVENMTQNSYKKVLNNISRDCT